jgi:MFS family permease
MERRMNTISNPQRRTALACTSIIILGLFVVFLPAMLHMDMMKNGFGISFIGGFVVIVGIITVIVFARLAGLFDNIMKSENILAHWTYSTEEWQQYTEEEHKEDNTDKRRLFLLVAAISWVVGIIMWAIYPHDGLLIFFIILGIIVVIGLTAFLSALSPYRWNKKHLGEVYIAKDGAYINRRLHIWRGLGTGLMRASYEVGSHSLPWVKIQYSSQNLATRNYYTARIPVPQGQEEAAQTIVAQIQASQLKKWERNIGKSKV